MSDDADWNLVEQVRTGHSEAFRQLVLRYQTPLVHFCRRMTGSTDDAEDLAQESFIKLFRYLPRLRREAKFSTVLFGIARNLTLNHLRDAKRRGRGKTDSLTRLDQEELPVNDGSGRPDHAARCGEIEQALQDALAELSPEHREIVLLRELQGMDYDAIAAVVGCRNGTVKSRLARAREQLRLRLLERNGDLL